MNHLHLSPPVAILFGTLAAIVLWLFIEWIKKEG